MSEAPESEEVEGEAKPKEAKGRQAKGSIEIVYSDAYENHEDDFDVHEPKTITCPSCEAEMVPDVELKWSAADEGIETSFLECLCPCLQTDQYAETSEEVHTRRDRQGARRIYIHVCPQCHKRIMYHLQDEEIKVFD